MALIYLSVFLIVLFFIILFILNKKDKFIKKTIKSFFGSLYVTVIIGLNILATINSIIFELLLLACFVIAFLNNKKDNLAKRLYKSSIHSLSAGIITFIVTISFLNDSYDMQDLYPNTNIFEILEFLGYASIYVIPLLYILIFLIINKNNKNKIENNKND